MSSTGTWHWKAETAGWSDEQWQALVGRRVHVLAPTDPVTAVAIDDRMVCIRFTEGSWNFVRALGETIWVEDQ